MIEVLRHNGKDEDGTEGLEPRLIRLREAMCYHKLNARDLSTSPDYMKKKTRLVNDISSAIEGWVDEHRTSVFEDDEGA